VANHNIENTCSGKTKKKERAQTHPILGSERWPKNEKESLGGLQKEYEPITEEGGS